jgi:PAS domain-containing protein
MDRRNDTRTDKSQGSDHGTTSPKSIIHGTDFRIVAADAPVMLWLTDAEGKVVFTNSKRNTFLGVASERTTLASDAWIKALHPDYLELCMKTIQ